MPFAPEPFDPDHDIAGFECGVASLDTWLDPMTLMVTLADLRAAVER